VTYQTALRTVFRMQIHAEVAPGCCPGWQKRSPRDLSCAKPVCSEPCEHGGQCVRPDLCLCTDGFTGYRCHLDIDECTGRNSCQQRCTNVHGSYQCTCQAGFRLADDKYTCDLCLNCTQEFQDLQEKLQTLEESSRQNETFADMKRQLENLTDTRKQEYKLEHIQQQECVTTTFHLPQAELKSSLKTAVSQYEAARRDLETAGASTEPSPSTDPYELDHHKMPLDRLASLSEQISILEERMADCKSTLIDVSTCRLTMQLL
ncbi:unnamed protein product, partial [Candidula unifasciata]